MPWSFQVTEEPTVFVVDDDPSVLDSLSMLISSVGLRVRTYPSATSFLRAYAPSMPGCLVTDIRMPGITGIELVELLDEERLKLPVIMMTGHIEAKTAAGGLERDGIVVLEKLANDQYAIDMGSYIRSWLSAAITSDSQHARDRERHRLATSAPREVTTFVRRPSH